MARSSPACDPQREEVYRMEKRGLYGLARAFYTRADLRALLKDLCRKFDLPMPILEFKPDTTCDGLYQSNQEIGWSKIMLSTAYNSGRSPLTLVHEFAHHAVDSWDVDCRLFGHGPEWVGVYGDCLAMAGLVPYAGFRALCVQYKVDFLDTMPARTVPALRKMVKKRAAEAALNTRPPIHTLTTGARPSGRTGS